MAKVKTKPSPVGTVVSLFTGAGGMDIGFANAGFEPVWANDIDPHAIATYRTMFPNHDSVVGDISKVGIPMIRNVDLVIGGPPCQGFSVAGRMDPNDPRSKHVWNFLGAVKKLRPRGFVMENVKALATLAKWSGTIAAIQEEATSLGYDVRLFVLNAADYGVPQARERMFLIGTKGKQHSHPEIPASHAGKRIATKEALSALPAFGTQGNDSACTARITPAKSPILRKSPYAGMLFNGQGRPLNHDAPALTLPASMGGNRTPIIDQEALIENSESWVVKYHRRLLRGGRPVKSAPEQLRRLTVQEAAVLQSFPTTLKFKGPQSAQFAQIGNAVPPMLAYNVARYVATVLES